MFILCKYFVLTWGGETNRRWDWCVCFSNHLPLHLMLSEHNLRNCSNRFHCHQYFSVQEICCRTKFKPNASVSQWQALKAWLCLGSKSIFSQRFKLIFTFSKTGQKNWILLFSALITSLSAILVLEYLYILAKVFKFNFDFVLSVLYFLYCLSTYD